MVFLVVSCGQKGATTNAKFKIFSANMIDPQVTFPGGLMVMGRNFDDSQSFMVLYKPGLELGLKKGFWEFATIGWTGANPMEGNQQCAYLRAEVITDLFTVDFNMNYQSCLNAKTVEGKSFSHPIFYNVIGGTYNGFKKLNVKTCADINACATQSMPVSFRVGIQGDLGGSLISNCVSGTDISNITPPHGGPNGFISMRISLFSAAGCTGVEKTYYFDHGFGEVLDRSFYDASGALVTRRGALSFHATAPDATIALNPINFYGAYSNNAALPTLMGANDTYVYTGGTMGLPPYASTGNYLYYDSSVPGWTTFAETASVKLLLEY